MKTHICGSCANAEDCTKAYKDAKGITECDKYVKRMTLEERCLHLENAVTQLSASIISQYVSFNQRVTHIERAMTGITTYTNRVIKTLKEKFGI